MNLNQFKKELLRDPEFKKEYEKYDLALEIGQMLIEARIQKGLTQEKLAKMIGTQQSGIARAERASTLPSLSFLDKIAQALHTHLIVKFGFMEEGRVQVNKNSSAAYHIQLASPFANQDSVIPASLSCYSNSGLSSPEGIYA